MLMIREHFILGANLKWLSGRKEISRGHAFDPSEFFLAPVVRGASNIPFLIAFGPVALLLMVFTHRPAWLSTLLSRSRTRCGTTNHSCMKTSPSSLAAERNRRLQARRGLALYFAILVPLSAVFETLMILGNLSWLWALMWTPAAASVVARLILREGFADVSFRVGGIEDGKLSCWR